MRLNTFIWCARAKETFVESEKYFVYTVRDFATHVDWKNEREVRELLLLLKIGAAFTFNGYSALLYHPKFKYLYKNVNYVYGKANPK